MPPAPCLLRFHQSSRAHTSGTRAAPHPLPPHPSRSRRPSSQVNQHIHELSTPGIKKPYPTQRAIAKIRRPASVWLSHKTCGHGMDIRPQTNASAFSIRASSYFADQQAEADNRRYQFAHKALAQLRSRSFGVHCTRVLRPLSSCANDEITQPLRRHQLHQTVRTPQLLPTSPPDDYNPQTNGPRKRRKGVLIDQPR